MTTRTPVDTTVVALLTGSLTVVLAGAIALGHAYAGRADPVQRPPSPPVSTPTHTNAPTEPTELWPGSPTATPGGGPS